VGGLRFDLNHLNGDDPTTDNFLEQGFMWVDLTDTLKLTFGKFNAPMGFELLDPNQMYQFSHAMVFNFGVPTNVTGVMVSTSYRFFDLSVYLVNGWDQITDDNRHKTVGGRLGVTLREGFNFGFSVISGDEGTEIRDGGNGLFNRTVVDLDTTITALPGFTIGGELNWGSDEDQSVIEPGADAEWVAWLVMVNFAFPTNDKVGITFRYDGFRDEEGARLGSGIKETRNALTFSPSYSFGKGFGALLESNIRFPTRTCSRTGTGLSGIN
jgi:hypothetical protein